MMLQLHLAQMGVEAADGHEFMGLEVHGDPAGGLPAVHPSLGLAFPLLCGDVAQQLPVQLQRCVAETHADFEHLLPLGGRPQEAHQPRHHPTIVLLGFQHQVRRVAVIHLHQIKQNSHQFDCELRRQLRAPNRINNGSLIAACYFRKNKRLSHQKA